MSTADGGPMLALDTTTGLGGVALLGGHGMLAEYSADVRGSHGARLMGAVESLLKDAGVTLAELGGIAVSVGPGSFTGLRVGVATALGLARSAGLPVYPVATLETVAWGVPRRDGEAVAVAMTSRRNEVYGAVYRLDGEMITPLVTPRVATPAGFLATLHDLKIPLLLTGNGAPAVAAHGAQALPVPVRQADAVFWQPRATLVAWQGVRQQAAGVRLALHEIAPIYLAASQAEIALAARQQKAGG